MIVPVALILFTENVPSTVKSFVIITSLLGTITLPVPLAANSKSALLEVVVIKLSSINISSSCRV